MTNFISLSLLVTNLGGTGPIKAVQIGYECAGPYAIMAGREVGKWQLLVSTTNDGPHKGTLLTSRIDRHIFWLNTNVFTAAIPQAVIERKK